tara:strand:+ start:211 stop:798 length:588 start_codon:yes stop_codon:yes gene_type:complete
MAWLPENYEAPTTNNIYFRPQTGTSKIRILGDFRHAHTAVMGYLGWKHTIDGNTPIRGNMDNFQSVKEATDDTPKHFWALTIWDYSDQAVKCWEITQATIQQALTELAKNEAWGDPRQYNISITRKGEKLETSYSIIAEPKPMGEPPAEAIAAAKAAKIDLRELFIGESPFGVDKGSNEKPPVVIDQMPAGSAGL